LSLKQITRGIAGLAIIVLLLPTAAHAGSLVAAASSTRPVLAELQAAYVAEGGERFDVSYGASGNLTHQILRGAPYGIFLSADNAFVERLARAGLTRQVDAYGWGRLVFYAGSKSHCATSAEHSIVLSDALFENVKHFAIAHPELAPYGRAAVQALKSAGVWHKLREQLVTGNSVAQAAQYIATGAADCGLIAEPLAFNPQLAKQGLVTQVDPSLYPPVKHTMALMKSASSPEVKLYRFFRSEKAMQIFSRFGFRQEN